LVGGEDELEGAEIVGGVRFGEGAVLESAQKIGVAVNDAGVDECIAGIRPLIIRRRAAASGGSSIRGDAKPIVGAKFD